MWACWAAATATTLAAVLHGARNVPIQEDWHVIPALGGLQQDFLGWLWGLNNEHRVPLVKLVYVGLLRLWTDFRVGMIVSMLLLAAVSALCIVAARRLRGRTRWTDAFFPVAFLHLGHWENFTWAWQLQFVLATVFAVGLLLLIAPPPQPPLPSGRRGRSRALGLGACLLAIPLTGATALPFAPAVAAVLLWRSRSNLVRAASVLTLALTALYFVDFHRPGWVPPSPGLADSARTAFKVLALGFGPAAGAWWLVAGLGTALAFGAAAVILLKARAWPLLAFLAAAAGIAVVMGDGRASLVPYYGLPDRYALVAVPGLCCAYLAFDRYGRGRWARFGPAALAAVVVALVPLNTVYGLQFRDWYHDRVDTFAADLTSGVPMGQLSYYRPIASDPKEMKLGMWILHDKGVGVFKHLNRTGEPPAPTRRVDGLDGEATGWVTVGTDSSATLEPGRLTWTYEVTDTWAAVGRTFPAPQDWRGMGYIALSLDGTGSGRIYRLRLGVSGDQGQIERYDSVFVDDRAGPHTITIPWNGFGHVNVPGVYDLEGPLPLDRIVSVTFMAIPRGSGTLAVTGIGLVPGHGQLGWPLHPSAERRSLPPWR